MLGLDEKLLAVEGITPLNFDDEHLFRIAFPRNRIQYSRSWLYVLRASHISGGKMGFKYVAPDILATIGYRNNFIYILPVFTKNGNADIEKLCEIISRNTGVEIIIKKLDSTPLQRRNQTNISEDIPFEDELLPESMLQLQRLFIDSSGTTNPAAKRLLRKEKTFNENPMTLDITDDITAIPIIQFEEFFSRDKRKYAAYMPMIRYLHSSKNRAIYKTFIFSYQNHVRGVYIGELLSTTELGFYCGVTSKDVPGITEWMDSHFFRVMFKEGIYTVYLGGAERVGIKHFVDKLLPYAPAYLTHPFVFSPTQQVQEADIQIRMARERDFKNLAVLYRETYNSLGTLDEHWTQDSAHKFISHFYRRQSDLFFVAEYEGNIIGATVAGIQPWWDGNHLVEGELFVDPDYAHLDTSRLLLRSLLEKAREKYHAVAWDTILPNVKNHPLSTYEDVGFKDIPHWRAVSGDTQLILNRLSV